MISCKFNDMVAFGIILGLISTPEDGTMSPTNSQVQRLDVDVQDSVSRQIVQNMNA